MREIDRRTFIKLCLGTAGAAVTRSWLLKDQQKAASSYTDPNLTTAPPPDQTPTPITNSTGIEPPSTPVEKQFAQATQTTDSEEEIKALRREHISSRSPRPTETPLAPPKYDPKKYELTNNVREGIATYYSDKGCVGCSPDRTMANGKKFNENDLTLAYWETDLDEEVLVEDLDSGLSAVAKVTDRGGFRRYNFIADLSLGLRNKLGGKDLTKVRITLLRRHK